MSEGQTASEQTASEQPAILVVDDQERIGRLLVRILGANAEVESRESAREALAMLEERRFDAVLCDLYMPEMTGMEMYRRVADDRPEMADRIVFLTGGTPGESARAFIEEVDNPRIYKPFDFDELAGVLGEVMGRDFEL